MKTVLVTGANSGIGKALCKRFAKDGFRIIMVCRNFERGTAALEEIKQTYPTAELEIEICDLGSLKDVQRCSDRLLGKLNHLDLLVNNAGVITVRRKLTFDGFEQQFGVNHLGHFSLTRKLMPLLENSPEARIVILSSGAHKIGKMFWDDLQLERKFSFIRAYSRSKLANLLFCLELSNRLKDSGITVNAVHPGAVASQMGVARVAGFGKIMSKIITSLLRPFFQTPYQGSETAYYVSTNPDIRGVSGRYFVRSSVSEPAKRALDRNEARKLWETSERLVGSILG